MKQYMLIGALFFSNTGFAMSKLYDADASVLMKNGKPCFYISTPIEKETPDFLAGEGVHAAVFKVNGPSKWDMWMEKRLRVDPVTPKSCIPYGMKSPIRNDKLALPLNHGEGYYFSLTGEYGRYRVYFCVKKDSNSNKDYLVKADKYGHCLSESL
ncbi:hypothetical protein [Chromobacterium sp. ATCC 53434]|uniref:hypothetical protein n=1 Tax=Chromobacterium sp. (strain ATCC 53434 / SC 14030) TaxID=2059672 RepID=UPI0013053B78|nr:hypothetical protein [Chromobacterium sp. ATCC 53434]